MKSIDDVLKMAANVQAEVQRAQEKLDQVMVEGSSGGGMVKVTASAKGRITGLSIDPSLLTPSDKEMLEDLVVAAINDARVKADAAANEEMRRMTAGMPLPPGFKLPI